ncbi:MAG TPA: glutamate 5-kinase [Candidatus Binataceae bacterium]|nr:glutamate 5-kinase [Candidatus Binataceae bacterium]
MPQLNYKRAVIEPVRRIVVKVGSAVLSDSDGLRREVIYDLASQISTVMSAGREVILVTSGAIAAGRARLGRHGTTIAERQAAAATGQIELMRQWARAFDAHGRTVAQLLLTHQDLAERKRRLNAAHTIEALLATGVIPIVNENDTVAVEEIRMGDNDVLSSLVAGMIQAGLLIILSDVEGVLTGDPRKRADACLIPLIADPEAGMRGLVADSAGPLGSGGMATKLKAARQAARAGISVVIARGRQPNTLAVVLDPERETGTLVLPARHRMRGRKHWIAFALRPSGALGVDRGAAEALRKRGRSLLPSGIREVSGSFASGDCVSLVDQEGVEFGRGLVNYPSTDVLKVKGMRSHEISRVLGYKVADEIIHRDNFVLIEELA